MKNILIRTLCGCAAAGVLTFAVGCQTDKQSSAASAPLSNTEINQKMASYYAAIWSKIKGQWSLPRDILSKENIETVIQARILRNGAISDIIFEKRSGNRYFDDSAMKAIKKASPLPPLPEWIRDNSIEIGIRFHSSEFR